MLATDPIQGFDVVHQLWRLRHAKKISDGEAELIMRTIASNLQTYDQVTQVSSVTCRHCSIRKGVDRGVKCSCLRSCRRMLTDYFPCPSASSTSQRPFAS